MHDGSPTDSTGTDYYVTYKEYIKNVASSVIYSTWPQSTIEANILAIMSFTLNRVYTEWYRNKGYDSIEILRYYYGDNMYINTAESIAGIPSSLPGYDLTIGSSGDKVRQIQEQLNRISVNYPLIPKVTVDGTYGEQTANAVKVF